MELKPLWNQSAGDHELYLFDVLGYKANQDNGVLTMRDLGEKGIVRI